MYPCSTLQSGKFQTHVIIMKLEGVLNGIKRKDFEVVSYGPALEREGGTRLWDAARCRMKTLCIGA